MQCYGYCKDNKSELKYSLRKSSKMQEQVSVNICDSDSKLVFSKYFKRKRHLLQRKYYSNVLHRQQTKEYHKRHYQENVLYRQKLKEMSKVNYKENVLHRKKSRK